MINEDLNANIEYFDTIFTDCGDIVKRKFPVGGTVHKFAFLIYIDNMSNRELLDRFVVKPLMNRSKPQSVIGIREDVFATLSDTGIPLSDISEADNMEDANIAILSGDAALFFNGYNKAIIMSSKGFASRSVSEAQTEVVVQGPKDAFTEVIRTNTCLVRRRIRSINLKVRQLRIGTKSKTDIALMYLADIVRPEILEEALNRINNINIDAIFDVGYIEQLIEDDWISPFPQCAVTERPDKAAAAILEGRIVIVVDNSPFVLMIPATFNTFFQSAEDYYQRFEIMSFIRIIRFCAGFITVCLPALYVAIASFQPSLLPLFLTLKMAGSRAGVPLPNFIEVILMDLAFELLKEAGIRLPGAVGGTIGIVGGIIIGQAAVEAGLVSPIVVIVIALTGICSFAIPQSSLVNGFRLTKYLLLIFSAVLGLFGFWAGVLLVLIHLVSLKTFGIPYMFPYVSGSVNGYDDLKDTIIRVPLFLMKHRPIFAKPFNNTRIRLKESGNIRTKE